MAWRILQSRCDRQHLITALNQKKYIWDNLHNWLIYMGAWTLRGWRSVSKKDSMENKRKLVISCTMQISHYGPLREDSKKFKKKENITDFGMFTCKCFEEHRWEAILCSFITRQLTFPRLLNPSLGFLRPSLLKFWGPSLCQGNLVNSKKPYHKLHRISMKKSQC